MTNNQPRKQHDTDSNDKRVRWQGWLYIRGGKAAVIAGKLQRRASPEYGLIQVIALISTIGVVKNHVFFLMGGSVE